MSRPYPEYRDSGDVWLGALPSHWEVRRLKQVAHAYPSNVDKKSHEGELPVRLCNYTDVYYNDVIADADGLMAATASEEQIEKFSLRAGDVIITKDSETADDIAVSAYVPDDLPGVVCGYHLSMIRPKAGTSGAFLKRYFDSHYAKASVAVRANGLTRVGLGQYAVDNLLLPVPPLEEQTAIAALLDRETGKIDALVEAQRRLIDLLKEKRQALVSHAVTKGLDLAATMTDSGVEWLGNVPAHWQVAKLSGICAKIGSGKTPSGGGENYVDAGIAFLRSQNVYDEGLWLDELVYIPEAVDEEMSNTRVQPGDILLNITGASLGRTCIVPTPFQQANVNQHVCIIRLRDAARRDFVSLAMKSISTKGQIDAMQNGAAREGLNFQQIASLRIALPPVEEAIEIVKAIGSQIDGLDRLTEEAEAGIALLQERRAALISAAIAGKIDVREIAPPGVVDRATARRIVGAAVLELVADTPTSGRMTSAKRMYLAEAHAGVWELRGKPQRMAAGPFDGALMSEVEAELARVGHIETSQPGGPKSQVQYRLTGQLGALRAELDALLGDRRAAFDKMLADLGELESKGVEAVATLFAVWNDMLIDGETPTDDAVVDGVLNDWHAEKRDKFTKADLRNYLGWMGRHGMTPKGRGPRTKSGALL
ncbi:MAG: restriction endonuclease subunit S [Caulobacterales bacterium]|nr:restriction endonuclease subunit S [Caulobacterales bacterium]